MSKPDINPKQSASGIAVDPRTLERVIPESKRPDGSLRKQIKIRPGFTPQEDVSRFRGSRQQQMDRTSLPKGHILGWVAPSSEAKASSKQSIPGAELDASGSSKPLSKTAAKNAKRKAKKQAEKEKVILANWDDEDSDEAPKASASDKVNTGAERTDEKGKSVSAATSGDVSKDGKRVEDLADELQKLDVR